MQRRDFLKILATVPVVALATRFPLIAVANVPTVSLADKIEALYMQYLGRRPSREEIALWLDGWTPTSERIIALSPEAMSR